MEERLPPAPSLPPESPPEKNDLNTYVVRVPKDQVYRFPPPENARLAEQHQASTPKQAKTSRCCLCCIVVSIVILVLLIVLGGILGGIFSMLLSPKDPQFLVERFTVGDTNHSYIITLNVHNPNADVGISYKNNSSVSLSLDGKQIAKGEYPGMYVDHLDSTSLGVPLKGSTTPKKVKESMSNTKKKVPLTFSTAIRSRARMKMGLLRSGTMTFDVSCTFKLDTLVNSTRILSQQCQTKRH
ncbi:Late embryogenesis abundant protein [Vigna unguiculata]|uniref:Late embryogenesis abundant protein n=1 Tax=Vigna unguiculata TaxID=3917 RepID=A0A4D6NQH3_VIGUN|nr:Late embryogenesis abundant protein [Vigna unguiculata]